MNVLQLIYTSCRKGLTTGAGFQTRAMSDGITAEERKELERLVVYIPPMDLQPQPTPEEIESDFPIAFGFFQLKSGRYGVFQSKYIGKDYSGRFGNYFAHALILETGQFPFYPTQLWASPIFQTYLETDDIPLPLPPLSIDTLTANLVLTMENLEDFISQTEPADLLGNLTAVLNHSANGRRLVFCDDNKNVAKRIAALQMALPLKQAHNLTFNTYTIDPEGIGARMCGTSRHGGRFSFSSTQSDFEYYVFNYLEGIHSRVDGGHAYLQAVETAWTLGYDNLVAFFQFITPYEYKVLDNHINAAYWLYQLRVMGPSTLPLSELTQAIQFADTYGTPETIGVFALSIADIISHLPEDLSPACVGALDRFLFKIVKHTEEHKQFLLACRFHGEAIRIISASTLDTDAESAIKLNHEIQNLNKHQPKAFTQAVAPSETLKAWVGDMNRRQPLQVRIFLFVLLDNLRFSEITWEEIQSISGWKDCFQTCFRILLSSEKQLTQTLTDAPIGGKVFHSLILSSFIELLDPNQRKFFAKCFAAALKLKLEAAAQIRDGIAQIYHGDMLLFAEFEQLLSQSQNKVAFFHEYDKTVFKRIQTYQNSSFIKASKTFIESLSSDTAHQEAGKLFFDPRVMRNVEFARYLFGVYENGLAIRTTNDITLAKVKTLLKFKMEREIETIPNILGLIYVGGQLETSQMPFSTAMEEISALHESIEKLNNQKYCEWLAWVIPLLTSKVTDPREFDQLISSLEIIAHEPLEHELSKCLVAWGKRSSNDDLERLSQFGVFFTTILHIHHPSRPALGTSFKKVLFGLGERKAKQIDNAVSKSDLMNSVGAKKLWGQIRKDVEEMDKNSLMGKIKGAVSFLTRTRKSD